MKMTVSWGWLFVLEFHVQNVAGLDNHAPASPDGTGTHEGGVLGEGELLSGTGEIGDTGDDEAPLQNCVSQDDRVIHDIDPGICRAIGNKRVIVIIGAWTGISDWKSDHRTFMTGALQPIC